MLYFCVLERHDAVFVVGALDEALMLRGMRYHPIDIENSVIRCHRKICEWFVCLIIFQILIKMSFVRIHLMLPLLQYAFILLS